MNAAMILARHGFSVDAFDEALRDLVNAGGWDFYYGKYGDGKCLIRCGESPLVDLRATEGLRHCIAGLVEEAEKRSDAEWESIAAEKDEEISQWQTKLEEAENELARLQTELKKAQAVASEALS